MKQAINTKHNTLDEAGMGLSFLLVFLHKFKFTRLTPNEFRGSDFVVPYRCILQVIRLPPIDATITTTGTTDAKHPTFTWAITTNISIRPCY